MIRSIASSGFATQLLIHPGLPDEATEPLGAAPDRWLGAAPRATERAMAGFEELCRLHAPDLVVVYGDDERVAAAAFVAARLRVPIARIEAGFRSGDPTDSAEGNRILLDRLADLHFTSSADRDDRLLQEGVVRNRIHRVGSVIVDAVSALLPRARARQVPERMGLSPAGYAFVALRNEPGLVRLSTFDAFLECIEGVQQRLPTLVALPPSLAAQIDGSDLAVRLDSFPQVIEWRSADLLDRLDLAANAQIVLTDDGFLQEVTSGLGIPCLTVASDVDRAITLTEGSNYLVGLDPAAVARAVAAVLSGTAKIGRKPRLWDGRACERIAGVIEDFLLQRKRPRSAAAPARLLPERLFGDDSSPG